MVKTKPGDGGYSRNLNPPRGESRARRNHWLSDPQASAMLFVIALAIATSSRQRRGAAAER
jgi:hypothetical protein